MNRKTNTNYLRTKLPNYVFSWKRLADPRIPALAFFPVITIEAFLVAIFLGVPGFFSKEKFSPVILLVHFGVLMVALTLLVCYFSFLYPKWVATSQIVYPSTTGKHYKTPTFPAYVGYMLTSFYQPQQVTYNRLSKNVWRQPEFYEIILASLVEKQYATYSRAGVIVTPNKDTTRLDSVEMAVYKKCCKLTQPETGKTVASKLSNDYGFRIILDQELNKYLTTRSPSEALFWLKTVLVPLLPLIAHIWVMVGVFGAQIEGFPFYVFYVALLAGFVVDVMENTSIQQSAVVLTPLGEQARTETIAYLNYLTASRKNSRYSNEQNDETGSVLPWAMVKSNVKQWLTVFAKPNPANPVKNVLLHGKPTSTTYLKNLTQTETSQKEPVLWI